VSLELSAVTMSTVMLSAVMLIYAEFCYVDCRGTERHGIKNFVCNFHFSYNKSERWSQ